MASAITILVVEDEAQIRELVVEMLNSKGYNVIAADSGKRAIELYKNHRDEIELILTDVLMPEMDGRKLVQNLTSIKDDKKVLFMSGYTDSIIEREGILDPETHFIQKPFSPLDLINKIQTVLKS